MILDQRHIYGGTTPEEIRARWVNILAGNSAARVDRSLAPIALTETGTSVAAYVNHGRWVARCQCGSGMGCWVENPEAACMDCGRIYAVEWPDPGERVVAEEILSARADPTTRNWDPATETVDRLNTENTLLEGVI